MHLSINKAKTAAVIAVILLMSSITLMTMPARAQYTNIQEGGSIPLPTGVTPDFTVSTTAHLSFRPNPIGVGQIFLVNMWLTPSIHVSRYFTGFKVTITRPNGTQDVITMDSYQGDATAWFEYVADQVGTWKLKFDFLGGYFPPGNYTVVPQGIGEPYTYQAFTESCYYKPSSTAEQKLVVQGEMVLSWPPAPLPTDYWTRPVIPNNREWWPILGNYPATGVVGGGPMWDELYPDTNAYMSNYQFTPWIQAPNTAHIVWRRQMTVGGLIGGTAGQYRQDMLPIGGPSGVSGNPKFVYAGRCYVTTTIQVDGVPTSCAVCYDLRTGEMYYARPISEGGVTPSFVEYPGFARQCVPGARRNTVVKLFTISGGRIIWVDGWTGAVTLNFSIAPLTTATYYDAYPLFLSVQNLGSTVPVAQRYRLINWTLTEVYATPSYKYRLDVLNNITWPWSSLPSTIDFEAGVAASVSDVTIPATGVRTRTSVRAASLTTGAELWNITIDQPQYSGSCAVADHGKIAVFTTDGYYTAWDLYSGKEVWKSETMDYPWDSCAFGAYAAQSAYGLLYHQAYSGIYAFNWTNGKIAWKYEAPAIPYETSYVDATGQAVYSWDPTGAIIADGKLYAETGQHGEESGYVPPTTRGYGLHCINATTGEGIWKITGLMYPGAVADGYLATSNSYDAYLYVFGKGKSQTTVSASPAVITQGSAVLIQGTVMDMSPGDQGSFMNPTARLDSPTKPSTVPCVSKESMETLMEYLYMQMPIDGLWHNETITGVPVTLTAIGSDGTVIDIGTTTTNGYGGTFGMSWTPPKEDTYTIMASFAGDDSYGSSMATTAMTVGPAPTATPTPTPQPQAQPDNTPLIYATVAIIIAIAIATILILRKRA